MPEVTVKATIPDGWELACDEVRAPKKGDDYLACIDQPTVVRALSDHAPSTYKVILRKAWQWPEWLTSAAIVKTSQGSWNACEQVPVLNKQCFCGWTSTGARVPILECHFAFTPPECDDWTQSLRINPKVETWQLSQS